MDIIKFREAEKIIYKIESMEKHIEDIKNMPNDHITCFKLINQEISKTVILDNIWLPKDSILLAYIKGVEQSIKVFNETLKSL